MAPVSDGLMGLMRGERVERLSEFRDEVGDDWESFETWISGQSHGS